MSFLSPEQQLLEIQRGAEQIYNEDELLAKLKVSYEKNIPLRIKFGADPSRPDLHLGHTVIMNKLKTFQNLGHHIIFIIGDFTAQIGDPTGRNKTRPQLTPEDVAANAQTYKEQLFKILDPDKTEVVYNSGWLNKIGPMDTIRLLANHTVQQMLARDDFSTRYANNVPIFLHEMLYPIMQGSDSVHLKADVELGGTDQTFNLLLAREMQKSVGQKPQIVLVMPILEGTDGVKKMSKSFDNYISLDDSSKDMFGKIMSISDKLMLRYYSLLSEKSQSDIQALERGMQDNSVHPMITKKELAQEIVSIYWGTEQGKAERDNFEKQFSKKETPEDLVVHELCLDKGQEVDMLKLCVDLGFTQSKGEARRILKQNGMKLGNQVLTSDKFTPDESQEVVFKVGKLRMVMLHLTLL